MADDRDGAIQHFSVRPASQCLPIIVAASEVLRWVRRIRKSGRQSFLAGFEFGRAVERMFLSAAEPEFAGMGLATKQTFVRNQQNNRKRSAEAEVRRQSRKKLVEKEIARQKKVGERMNYQKGLEFAAKAEGYLSKKGACLMFKAAWKVAQEANPRAAKIPRGTKSKHGDIEAWKESG